MILSSTSHWTYRCPLAPLSGVRWTVGIFSAALWFRVWFADLAHETSLWTLLAAIITTQFFGTLSSALLMLRPRVGLLRRFTDWYAIVTSVMTWVIGVGALVSSGISFIHLALLLATVAIGVMWLVLIYFGLRPSRLGAIERE
jgi:hypothetical protein